MHIIMIPKNEIALLSTEAVSSAISESYELPKQFVRWQPDWPGTSCQFVSRQAIGGRCLPVGTRLASVNITSLAECGAVRLFFWWLSSTAGYVPGNEAQLSLSDIARHKRVLFSWLLPVFIRALRKTLRPSPAGLSASTKSVNSNCKPLCLCSLPEPRGSVRRSLRWSQRP